MQYNNIPPYHIGPTLPPLHLTIPELILFPILPGHSDQSNEDTRPPSGPTTPSQTALLDDTKRAVKEAQDAWGLVIECAENALLKPVSKALATSVLSLLKHIRWSNQFQAKGIDMPLSMVASYTPGVPMGGDALNLAVALLQERVKTEHRRGTKAKVWVCSPLETAQLFQAVPDPKEGRLAKDLQSGKLLRIAGIAINPDSQWTVFLVGPCKSRKKGGQTEREDQVEIATGIPGTDKQHAAKLKTWAEAVFPGRPIKPRQLTDAEPATSRNDALYALYRLASKLLGSSLAEGASMEPFEVFCLQMLERALNIHLSLVGSSKQIFMLLLSLTLYQPKI